MLRKHLALIILFMATALSAQAQATNADDLIARGRYLVTTSACHDCHTPFVAGPNGPELGRVLWPWRDDERLLGARAVLKRPVTSAVLGTAAGLPTLPIEIVESVPVPQESAINVEVLEGATAIAKAAGLEPGDLVDLVSPRPTLTADQSRSGHWAHSASRCTHARIRCLAESLEYSMRTIRSPWMRGTVPARKIPDGSSTDTSSVVGTSDPARPDYESQNWFTRV